MVDRLTQNSSVCTPPGANGSSAWAHAQIGRLSRRPIPSSARNMCGRVLTFANFGIAALPDTHRAVPGDANAAGDANRAVIDAHTFLMPSFYCSTANAQTSRPFATRICYRRHNSQQQRNRGALWIWNRGP